MKITIGNVYTTVDVENLHEEKHMNLMKNNYRALVPGAQYTKQYQRWLKTRGKAGWDGMMGLINGPYGKQYHYLSGLNDIIQPHIPINFGVEIESDPNVLDRTELIAALSLPTPTPIGLRDYQEETIIKAFNAPLGRGILALATGAGKTEIAIEMVRRLSIRTVFIVHTKELLYQTQERFKNAGIPAGVLGDGCRDIRDVTIATVQTLDRATDIDEDIYNVDQLFFDEAHRIASKISGVNQFVKVAANFENATYRWGLTATPLKKDRLSDLLLIGVTGPVLHTITNDTLIKKKYLSPVEVRFLNVSYPADVPKSWPDCYDVGIVGNTYRNNKIIQEVKILSKPCLIMCNRIEHAENLCQMGKNEGINIKVVHGSHKKDYRQQIIKDLKSKKLDVVVCSTIFDEGVDIPSISAIILAGGGRSPIKLLQRIGRGLRLHKDKDKLVVIDFVDRTNKTLLKHSRTRWQTCKVEGFPVKEVVS